MSKRFRRRSLPPRPLTLKAAFVDRVRRSDTGALGESSFEALRDVNVDVRSGESVGLIGRNGAGKSTLLKLVAHIYRPSQGRVSTRGRIAPLLELGAGFHPEFSGRENLLINGMILGLSRRDIGARAADIVRFAGIEEFIDAPVRTYSSGMFMRLAFSVAIHVEPDILLIDEVLAVGDESFRRRSARALEDRLRNPRLTTLIASHDLDVVTSLCDRVVLIEPPQALVFDDPVEAVERYRSAQADA